MTLRALLTKELLWARRNVLLVLLLVIILPGSVAISTVVFQQVIPRDTPVAIVPQNESVTDDELVIVKGGLALFSDPTLYDSRDRALRALAREEVYAVVSVPHGLLDGNASITFVIYIDRAIVPYEEPSRAIVSLMSFRLDRSLPADVDVDRRSIGTDHTLSEYLLPVGLMLIVMLFAFAFVPYTFARDRPVLDRLRVDASLDAVIASKLLFFMGLLVVPFGIVWLVADHLAYSIAVLPPVAIAIYLLTFLYLVAIGVSVMLLTGFDTVGRFVNVVLLFGLLAFSSLIYPVGFFSDLRKSIARLSPLHHSMIIARSVMLKDAPLSLFADRIGMLVGVTIGTLLVLKLSLEYYERRA